MSTKYKFLNPEGIYFVSFAVVGWVDVFTRTKYKEIFLQSMKYCQQHKGLVIHAWCLMTNHVHLIFSGGEPGKPSGILRDLKKYTAIELLKAIASNPKESRKEWRMKIFTQSGKKNSNNSKYQLWQQDNHPVEIYSPKVVSQKLEYVHNNPVNSGIVQKAEHYLYSSARNYSNQKGVIDVEILDIPGSLVGCGYVG